MKQKPIRFFQSLQPRRSPKRLVPLLCMVAGLFGIACGGSEAPRPNVILIVVDTLRPDHLGSYGHWRDTSPNLDRLAGESTRFTRAYSQASWTTPSIGALFASRYPTSLGITDLASPLPDEPVMLAEFLQGEGWKTAAYISHSFCSAKWNFSQGFDSFDGSNIKGHIEITSPGISDMAIEWLRKPKDTPFFLFLHYFDPHGYFT